MHIYIARSGPGREGGVSPHAGSGCSTAAAGLGGRSALEGHRRKPRAPILIAASQKHTIDMTCAPNVSALRSALDESSDALRPAARCARTAHAHARTHPPARTHMHTHTSIRTRVSAHTHTPTRTRADRRRTWSTSKHAPATPGRSSTFRTHCNHTQAPTSAPGLTGLSPLTKSEALRGAPAAPTSAPGLGSPLPTSAPGLGSPRPHLRWDWSECLPGHVRHDGSVHDPVEVAVLAQLQPPPQRQ
jgi:hypothetical protein